MSQYQGGHSRSRGTDGAAAGRAGDRRSRFADSRRPRCPEHPRLGQDAGSIAGVGAIGMPLRAALDQPVDVVIDFSVPAGALAIAAVCMERRIPLVVATTGLSDAQQEMLREAAARIPLLWSPSMSLAVNLTMKLAEIAAQALADHPTGTDVEIIERHHRFKEDSPSGTALKFGEIIADAMGQTGSDTAAKGRRQTARTARSAITPSASATTRASTRSSSACWARRSS